MAATEHRSRKPTIAAVLCFLTGAVGLVFAILGSSTFGAVAVVLGIIASIAAVLAGYYALQRRKFWWVVGGTACALVLAPTLGYRGIPLGLVLPVAALVLIWLSRREFH